MGTRPPWEEQTHSVFHVDGKTGLRSPAYNADEPAHLGNVAVHPDGTIFVTEASATWEAPDALVGIDPISGAEKFNLSLGQYEEGALPVIVGGDDMFR